MSMETTSSSTTPNDEEILNELLEMGNRYIKDDLSLEDYRTRAKQLFRPGVHKPGDPIFIAWTAIEVAYVLHNKEILSPEGAKELNSQVIEVLFQNLWGN